MGTAGVAVPDMPATGSAARAAAAAANAERSSVWWYKLNVMKANFETRRSLLRFKG
jgi:hypothetical protein